MMEGIINPSSSGFSYVWCQTPNGRDNYMTSVSDCFWSVGCLRESGWWQIWHGYRGEQNHLVFNDRVDLPRNWCLW